MVSTILGAVIGGLVIEDLARLVIPGKQDISILMTIVLGIAGSAIGSWIVYQLNYANTNGGFAVIPFIAGIVVAAILIVLYLSLTGRRGATR